MTRYLVLAVAWLALGCSTQADPREADIVVTDAALLPAARAALSWWQAAHPDLDQASIVAACSTGRACVTLGVAPLTDNDDGLTTWKDHDGSRFVWIDVDPSVTTYGNQVEVIAHELGHAFGMPHVSDPHDVMRAVGAGGVLCVGPETERNWTNEYGTPGNVVCQDVSQ